MDSHIIVKKIMESAGISEDELKKKVLDKQKELSNLVSEEGAAYIIAKELGIELFKAKQTRLEVKNVIPGIRNLNLIARVVRKFEVREFERNMQKSRVANIILGDKTGTVRMSFWDDQVELLDRLETGQGIELSGAYTREDNRGMVEIRLSKQGQIKLLETCDIPQITNVSGSQRVNITEIKDAKNYEIRAAVVQLFGINNFYEVCPECGKRIKKDGECFKCPEHGEVKPKYAMVLSGVIDDGYNSMRFVAFRNAATDIAGIDSDKIAEIKDSFQDTADILGNEYIFTGNIRTNQMFNRKEFVVSDVKAVDVKEEVNKIINALNG